MPMHISHHTRITNIVIMALVISVMLAVTKQGRSKQLQVGYKTHKTILSVFVQNAVYWRVSNGVNYWLLRAIFVSY